MAAETKKIEGENTITWIDFIDPAPEELYQVSKEYNLNPYTLMDSLDPDHLPKYEEHNDIHFIIIRLLEKLPVTKNQTIQSLSSKIAIFYTDTFVITIHRSAQPIIKDIQENYVNTLKIKTAQGIVLKIVRETLHSYEQPVIQLSANIDAFESKLFLKKNFPSDMIEAIYFLKNKTGIYKKLLLLSNEIVNAIQAEKENKPALQDIRDFHTKLLLLYDQVQDDANNLLNIYLSLSARKTNEVMKILTVFSVFFMPLTFIVGVYGMNFKYMPELSYTWGYTAVWITMIIVCVIVFLWFKRKKWL